MCVDPDATLSAWFYGYYLFMAEIDDAEGVKKRPTFVTKPTGNVPVFALFYQRMAHALGAASNAMDKARPKVDARHQLMFDAEDSAVQWFFRTARTEANFYESCQLRDRLRELAQKPQRMPEETAEAAQKYNQWRFILGDELSNAESALPVMEKDMRLNFRYGGDHTFEDGNEMLRAKIQLLKYEILNDLPAIASKLGIPDQPKRE
jgi:hypothetical protein